MAAAHAVETSLEGPWVRVPGIRLWFPRSVMVNGVGVCVASEGGMRSDGVGIRLEPFEPAAAAAARD